jgi:hypothetical protein
MNAAMKKGPQSKRGQGVRNERTPATEVSPHGTEKRGGQGATSDMTPPGVANADTLPSVLTISRTIHVLWADHARLEKAEMAARLRKDLKCAFEADCGKQLILDRIDALEELAMTQTAKNLADAAVQVVMAYDIAEDFENNDYTPSGRKDKDRDLKRLLASALPFILYVAQLKEADVGDWVFGASVRDFPDQESVP